MDITVPPAVAELAARTREFIAEVVIPIEEAGYSLLGPLALNCAAPDEGNMHLPGAGADPSMLAITAARDGSQWRIDGRKWFISGAHGAGFAICMARTSGAPGERGGGTESSMAKTFVAEAVNRVVDRSVQICGALGVSGDVLLARYLREVRPFRIYDGPSEVHRWAIGRRAIGQRRRAIEGGEPPRCRRIGGGPP
jgi:alkylation response protein AidB-like acyl-CoA dehydrogenase